MKTLWAHWASTSPLSWVWLRDTSLRSRLHTATWTWMNTSTKTTSIDASSSCCSFLIPPPTCPADPCTQGRSANKLRCFRDWIASGIEICRFKLTLFQPNNKAEDKVGAATKGSLSLRTYSRCDVALSWRQILMMKYWMFKYSHC